MRKTLLDASKRGSTTVEKKPEERKLVRLVNNGERDGDHILVEGNVFQP